MTKNKGLKGLINFTIIILIDIILFLLLKEYSIGRIINLVIMNIYLVFSLLFMIFHNQKNSFLVPSVSTLAFIDTLLSLILIFLNIPNIKLIIIMQILVLGFSIIFLASDKIGSNNK